MIDIHTHLLHAYDDGPPSLKQSLDALQKIENQGISKIILTPHHIRGSLVSSFELRSERFKEFMKEIKNRSKIKFELAAEVYLHENITSEIAELALHYPNTKYVLVETSMSQFPNNLEQILYDLVIAGYRPILAHPERYRTIAEKPEKALDLMHRNIYMQINAGSVTGYYGKAVQKTAWALLNKGYAHFLASDYHGKDEYLLPKAYEEVAQYIDSYTANLLTKMNPQKMLQDEKIELFYVKIEETQTSRLSRLKRFFRI